MSEPSLLELQSALRKVFPAEPPRANLWNVTSLEGQRVKSYFSKRLWGSVSLDSLLVEYRGDRSACLSFMTPAGAAYYLPAYLLMAITDPVAADMIFEGLMYEIMGNFPGQSPVRQGLATLNDEQKEVLEKCLEYLAQTPDLGVRQLATHALARWKVQSEGSSHL